MTDEHEHIVSRETMLSWHPLMKDEMSRYRIISLFWETRVIVNEDKYPPLFTSKDKPHTVPTSDKKGLITYPSLKEIYMSYEHIPGFEYEFSMDVFNSWDHWETLCRSSLKEMIGKWREELAIKLKCSSLKKMMVASKEGTAVGVNAARYLADEGYLPAKKGRVTKEEKERAARIAAGVRDTLSEDMERLGLEVISGTKG